MNEFEINAEARTDTGKADIRRLRRTGKCPAVVYGAGKEPQTLTIDQNELNKHLQNEAFHSHLLTLKIGAKKQQVVLKAVQRHPVTSQATHLDLLRASAKQKLHMSVPLHFINEEDCPGRKAGGVINHLIVDVEIICLPKDLPEFIEIDMAAMEMNDTLHLTDIPLPKGIELTVLSHGGDIHDQDQPVVNIAEPRVEEIIEDEEAEAGEGEEGEAGEEAADEE